MERREPVKASVVEYVLLVLAIAIHIWLFMSNELYLQPTALSVARYAESFEEFCKLVEYSGKCELAFAYIWLFSKIPPQAFVIFNILTLLITYIVTRRLLHSGIGGVFAAFMYAITPGILASYFLEQSGLLLLSPLIATTTLLTAHGLLEGERVYLAAGLALYVFMILHPAGFLPLLVGLILLLSDYVEGNITWWKVRVFLAMTLTAMIALMVVKPTNYDVYAVPLTAMSLGFLGAVHIARGRLQASYKAIILILTAILGVVCGLFIRAAGVYRSADYITTPSSIVMYGLPGLIAIPGFLLAIWTPTSHEERRIALIALPVALLTTIGHFAITTAIPLLAFTGSIVLSKLVKAIGKGAVPASKIYKLVAVLTLTTFIVVPVFCSYMASTRFTGINALSKEIVELSRERGLGARPDINLRVLGEEVADAVKSSARGEKVLVVTYWDYSYWVQSALAERGVKALTLSHPYGSVQSKSLVSRIFVNNWRTSREILKDISREIGVEDVYVLITTVYSAGPMNDSFVGVPQTAYTATGQPSQPIYGAYGDLINIPAYLKLANKTEGDYLFLGTGISERSRPLMWTATGRETLVVQLCILAMSRAGYSAVYNNMIETRPLNATVTGFELVYAGIIPVGEVNVAYYGMYSVYYMVALFKLSE
ncbi:MAG: hypothetical protein QXU03_02195 [Desulfurococcaceae archaeon]